MRELPRIAKWMIERTIPGVRVELGETVLELPGRLQFEKLVLFSRVDDTRLLTLRSGIVEFDFRELAGGRVALVELVEPQIEVSPKLLALLAAKPDGKPKSETPRRWRIGRVRCKYGEFRTTNVGPEALEVRGKFAFDFAELLADGPQAQEVVLWEVDASADGAEPFLHIDLAEIALDPAEVSRRIASVNVKGGSLALGGDLLALFAAQPATPGPEETGGITIGKLDIQRVAVHLAEDHKLGSAIQFSLNTSFANVPLSKAASALGEEPQVIEIADLEILSPLDPLAKVIEIRSLLVEFRLAGLLRGEIDAISVTNPSVYVSPDLFWYMDYAQERFATGGSGDTGMQWEVARFTLTGGKLLLGSGGSDSYGLPLTFRTSAENVSLGNLASLKATAALEIPAQDYVFENYQLEFTSRPGELHFGYPPEKDEKNIVGTVRLDALRWRQYRATESWVSVTFDRSGINGTFGGKVYGGYAAGGFSFFFDAESHWMGWIAGRGVSLRSLTDVISPQNFRMTGPLEFRLQADARRAEIQRVKGSFKTSRTGKLTISKLDDLLARVPDDWPAFKQDSVRIALETLRDFDYTGCRGEFWFLDSQGVLDLVLQGPSGSRTLKTVLHAEDAPLGRWKGPQ